MRVETLLALHREMCDQAVELMKSKNHDYTSGSSDPFANFRGSEMYGVHPAIGILIRIGDKFKRIQTFVEKGELKVKDEGLRDSVRDSINYLVLMYGMLVDRQFSDLEVREEETGATAIDLPARRYHHPSWAMQGESEVLGTLIEEPSAEKAVFTHTIIPSAEDPRWLVEMHKSRPSDFAKLAEGDWLDKVVPISAMEPDTPIIPASKLDHWPDGAPTDKHIEKQLADKSMDLLDQLFTLCALIEGPDYDVTCEISKSLNDGYQFNPHFKLYYKGTLMAGGPPSHIEQFYSTGEIPEIHANFKPAWKTGPDDLGEPAVREIKRLAAELGLECDWLAGHLTFTKPSPHNGQAGEMLWDMVTNISMAQCLLFGYAEGLKHKDQSIRPSGANTFGGNNG